jgi:hypothetical protein
MQYDAFISYADEDKEEIAKPLADALIDLGYTIWYDEYSLKVGDSLRRSIDQGLSNSRYAVVIFSLNFFKKKWTNNELDGLVVREHNDEKFILPVWHRISLDDIVQYSPMLAGRIAATTDAGLNQVVARLVDWLGQPLDANEQSLSATKRRKVLEDANRANQYTIDLYNEWHSKDVRASRVFVSSWSKRLYEQSIELPSLTHIENGGGDTEHHVFHVIHFFEKWATMSKHHVIDTNLLSKMLGSYLTWYQTNLIDPLILKDERNQDFKDLLKIIKSEVFDKKGK